MDKNDEAARFRLQPNKRWTPLNAHHTMTFIELFENQIKKDISKSKHYIKHKNLTNNELKALKELQKKRQYYHHKRRQRWRNNHPRYGFIRKRSKQTTKQRTMLPKTLLQPHFKPHKHRQ